MGLTQEGNESYDVVCNKGLSDGAHKRRRGGGPPPVSLTIRPFVPGQDEAPWVDVFNRAHREDEDFVPTTVEEFERWKKAPNSTDEGRFVASPSPGTW